MTTQERQKLLNNYATQVVDDMDLKTLCTFAVETIEQNMKDCSDEQLITEVKEYYPDLLAQLTHENSHDHNQEH